MKRTLSPQTKLSFYLLTKDKSFIKNLNLEKFDWYKFLKMSSFNRSLYFLINELEKDQTIQVPKNIQTEIKAIKIEAEKYLDKLEKTLKLTKEVLEKAKIDYLIVKTDRDLRFVTIDVDLFVDARNIQTVNKLFEKEANARIIPFHPKNQTDIDIDGLLRIDLHEDFCWFKQHYFDNNLIWENTRILNLEGYDMPAPSATIDMLLTIAHILYERLHITLLEFNYIKSKAKDIEWDFIFEQSKKYKWHKNLNWFCNTMNELNKTIFNTKDDLIPTNSPSKASIPDKIEMPYMFPFWQMIMIFIRNLVSRKHMKLYDVIYHIFASLRFKFTKGEKVPMFYHWHDFKK